MGLNKKILQKVIQKTKDDIKMQNFIVNILQEENRGNGRYTKFYKEELEKATQEANVDEN
jgi:hypothetical protein